MSIFDLFILYAAISSMIFLVLLLIDKTPVTCLASNQLAKPQLTFVIMKQILVGFAQVTAVGHAAILAAIQKYVPGLVSATSPQ